jgi:DNA-binding transcriptional LysR family regulator
MKGSRLSELIAFVAVAEERSFRKGAARLGLMPSTVSHMLSALESELGVRLLNRTTRSVGLTEAGNRLLGSLAPALTEIDGAVESLGEVTGRPTGTIRINVPRMAAFMVLAPAFATFAERYPEIVLEVAVDDGFVDIVARRFDAGIRLGDSVERDMVAIRVTGELRTAIVGSPKYFQSHPPPKRPEDLVGHRCIGYRQITSGALYRWEFEKRGRRKSVAVTGPLVLDDFQLMTDAALDSVGLSYATESTVEGHVREGRLIRVLEDWCESYAGFFLYYPSRRNISSALRALIDHLKV